MPPEPPETQRKLSFVRLGLVVLVVVGLGTLIWAIFIRTTPTNVGTSNGSGTSQNSQSQPKQTTPSQQKPKSSSSPSKSSSSSPSSSSPSAQQTQQLSNAGPGNVIALFAVASVLGVLSRSLYIRRQINKG
jgi:cytoskeletal protein RodZ